MKKLLAMMLMLLPMIAWGQEDISKLVKLANKRNNYLLGCTVSYNEALCPTDSIYVLAAFDEHDYYAPSFPALSGYKNDFISQLDKLIKICEDSDMEGMSFEENKRSFKRVKGKINIKYFDGRSKNFSLKDLKKIRDKIVEFSDDKVE